MGLYWNKGPPEVGLSTGQNLVKPKLRAERFTAYKDYFMPSFDFGADYGLGYMMQDAKYLHQVRNLVLPNVEHGTIH